MEASWLKKARQRCVNTWNELIVPTFAPDWDILLVVFFLAMALRLYFAFTVDPDPNYMNMSHFTDLARQGKIGSGDPPLYIFFLRIVYAVFGEYYYKAVFAIQGIFGSLNVFLIYGIITRISNRRAALTGAFITALYAGFIINGLSTLPETLAIFTIFLLSAMLVWEISDSSKSYLTAIFHGLAILIHPLMIFFVPGIFLIIKKRIIYLAVLLAILVPWTIRNSIVDQKPVPVYDSSAYSIDLDKYDFNMVSSGWHTVKLLYVNINTYTSKGWRGTPTMELSDEINNSTYILAYSYILVLCLGLIGLARYYRREQRALIFPSLGYIILTVLMTKIQNSVMHRTMIEPMLIIYSSLLLFNITDRLLKNLPTITRKKKIDRKKHMPG